VSPPVAFLDANILFSAALGGPVFGTIRELGRHGSIRLVTSEACVREALESLTRKRPDALEALDGVLLDVEVFAVRHRHLEAAGQLVGSADAHVVSAALTLRADVLVTGDRTHFGPLMERRDAPIRVRTPRMFLLEGPPAQG
jgi:predicted nucleic acid-binding protein